MFAWSGFTDGTITVLTSSAKELYEKIKEDQNKAYEETIDALSDGGDLKIDYEHLSGVAKFFWLKFMEVYNVVKDVFILALGTSVVIGILALLIFKKNKVIRKSAIGTFFVGVPLILFIIVYVIPSFAPIFTG